MSISDTHIDKLNKKNVSMYDIIHVLGCAHEINFHEINSRENNSYIANFSRGQLHANQL